MNFTQAVNAGIKYAFSLQGRASRSEFWYYTLFCGLVFFLCFRAWPPHQAQFPFLVQLVLLFLLISLFTLRVRRLHDVNRSGWWSLISIVPIAEFLLLYWYCQPGTLGANQFGPDPLGNRLR